MNENMRGDAIDGGTILVPRERPVNWFYYWRSDNQE